MDLYPNTTTTATGLIGYEELEAEPCDGTGTDAMAKRYHKWHKGGPAVPQKTEDAQKPIDLAALGAYIYNLCSSDAEAQRLVAMWQQSIRMAHAEYAVGEVDLPDAAAETAKPTAPWSKTTAAAEQTVEPKTYVCTYDSIKYRDSYPLCNAKYRTGLGEAFKKLLTAAPAGGVQRGPGGPPRGPGGPPRGPGGPPRGPGGPPRPNGNQFSR
ncbi:hypothetical protein AAVH_07100 [Aphelenchoides avenae]|nr:hypothetical protein AAVH_07100 [Aphelenchus avenae]